MAWVEEHIRERIAFDSGYTEATERSPMGGGNGATREVSHPLPTVVFYSSHLWRTSFGSKHLLLSEVTTTSNPVNRTARRLEVRWVGERNSSRDMCRRSIHRMCFHGLSIMNNA
jgi:hypothetical protein